MKKRVFGYVPSKMDGTEHIFELDGGKLPEIYNYEDYMSPILNQGNLSICVPCSISAYLNWRENLKDGKPKDNKIYLMDIYNCRTNEGDGMSFKEALRYLRHNGVKSQIGNLKITAYAQVKSIENLKGAIYSNGPCIGALPVYEGDGEFWRQRYGSEFLGGHAISIVGYDKDGFIIRNSWGTGFGKNGYVHMKYEDFKSFYEIWTIMD